MNLRLTLNVLRAIRQLRQHEQWTRPELLAHQAQALAGLRAQAYAHSPFYQRFHAGLTTAPLAALPVLTKAMLMEHFDEVVTNPAIRLDAVRDFAAQRQEEARFLDRYWVTAELTLREPLVLATGGGAVLRPENRRNLASRGCVVYLETSLNHLVSRVKRSQNRPLLQNVDAREKLRQLMSERAPLYAEVADLTISTDGRRVKAVAEEIARILPDTREDPES